jgi:hypothetical protein
VLNHIKPQPYGLQLCGLQEYGLHSYELQSYGWHSSARQLHVTFTQPAVVVVVLVVETVLMVAVAVLPAMHQSIL